MSFQKEVRKNPRISADVAAHACRNGRKRIAERTSKQKITSAASIRLMSALPEQPERLVEILRELIALSKTEGNHSELAPANGPTKLLDARCVKRIDQTSAARGKEARQESRDA